jgi:Transposase DDE domain
VAYVRKVRTASGAVAVQVARKEAGKVVIIEHVGSARTDAELGVLLQRARGLVDGLQEVLDLEVARRVARLDEVSDWRPPDQQQPVADAVAGPGRTVATNSRLLYEAIGAVYDALGFDALADVVFKDLVIARVVEPTSKLDSARVLIDLGADAVSYSTIQRHLRSVNTDNYRDAIVEKCFAHSTDRGTLSLVLYDVTTLYFEAENEDTFRKVGYSKERRIDPQIVVGLLVDRTGFPLEVSCFEGSTAETTTIVEVIDAYRGRHDLTGVPMVIAADAAMLSWTNLKALDEAGCSFIVGSRMTKAPGDLDSHFHWHGNAFADGQVIDTVTPRRAGTVVNNTKVKAEPVWTADSHPKAWRAIWQYRAARARRDQKTLDAQEARAKAVVAGEKKAKITRFVTVKGDSRTLDEASLKRARDLVGLKGYVTNIDAAAMAASEVIAKYHELWHVERSFRMSKHDLAARPIFHHLRESIEAHLTIVFTALAVAHAIQDKTGMAIANVVKQLRPLRSATIAINGTSQTFPPEIPDVQAEILTHLGIANRALKMT